MIRPQTKARAKESAVAKTAKARKKTKTAKKAKPAGKKAKAAKPLKAKTAGKKTKAAKGKAPAKKTAPGKTKSKKSSATKSLKNKPAAKPTKAKVKAKAKAAPKKAPKPAPAKVKKVKKVKIPKVMAPVEAPVAAAEDTMAETPTTPMPAVGEVAPDFTLATDQGGQVSLGDFLGKQNVVLYFYPKDDTSGCTKQACAFQMDLEHFTAKDTVVIGVSPDHEASHAKFRNKYGLTFALGADTDKTVAQRYGVWALKSLYGREYMGIVRTTFLIDKTGKIAAVWPKVKVDDHSAEVQAALANL